MEQSGQTFDNTHYSALNTRYDQAWSNNPYALAAISIDANSSVASQNNYTHHGVAAPPFFGRATVLHQNLPYNADSFTWPTPGRPEAGSTRLDSVASYTVNSYNSQSAGSYGLSSYQATLQGEAPNNNGFTFAPNANWAVASQYNYADRGATTLPFSSTQNGPAMVSHHHFNSFYITDNDSTHTPSGLPQNATTPEAESTDLGSVVSYTSSHGSSPHSYVAFPCSFGNIAYSETGTLYGDASNDDGYVGAPAVESLDANSPVAPQNNYADRSDAILESYPLPDEYIGTPADESFDTNPSVAPQNNYADRGDVPLVSSPLPDGRIGTPADELIDTTLSVTPQNNDADRGDTPPAQSPLPVQPALPETSDEDDDDSASDASEIVHSFSDLKTEIHEDEIFFRGTGLEGCLCPEMMIKAGVEGWDRSLLNTH